MKKILVTGAGGYLGTVLVPVLLDAGCSVRAVDRFFFGKNLLPQDRQLEICVEDTRRLTADHFRDVDVVVDLAAISNDPSGEFFQDATMQINFQSRVRTARLAKKKGVGQYILASSCSIYGSLPPTVVADEGSATNPLTTYACANELAEKGVLKLADEQYCVTVLRFATLYGLSPRMRFDLAVNGMSHSAWYDGRLAIMRDGSQWRPMLDVLDAARAIQFMIGVKHSLINQEIFNVGSSREVYQIEPLGNLVAGCVPRDVELKWYGSKDERSYRVSFDKIEAIGYRANGSAAEAVRAICAALDEGTIDKSTRTITLDWYKELVKWHGILRGVEMYGGVLEI